MSDLLSKLIALCDSAKEKNTILHPDMAEQITFVCRYVRNRAPIRFLLSCLASKLDNQDVDITKPYTEIGGIGTFSGRYYDENYIQELVTLYKLPCNSTTAYLTPAFRNIKSPLTRDVGLVGRPKSLYQKAVGLLNDVKEGLISPENLFVEIIRQLLILRDEEANRLEQLVASLETEEDNLPLSTEQIITLIHQHLSCRNSSRLPVLIIAAAYESVYPLIKERAKPLMAHHAADKQTKALGDVEIILANDHHTVTCYEMKAKSVSKGDIDTALDKIASAKSTIDNYIFITTDRIEVEVSEYAQSLYNKIGIEITILDCLGFLKHFLHFFHRYRTAFLNNYQKLVLQEPNSSVNQPLKEAFLTLRKAAETEL